MTLRLFDLPHRQARSLLQAEGAVAYLPVNPVEYHGPHLPLHNDALISAGLIQAMHDRLSPDQPLLVAADLEIGVEAAPGPGTRTTPLPIARRLIADAVDALADLGAQRVVLVTFHGSPLHSIALDHGVRRLLRRGVRAIAPMPLLLRELLHLSPDTLADLVEHIPDPADRRAVLARMPEDIHAGFLETSLTLRYAPDSVSPDLHAVPPCPPLVPGGAMAMLARLLARLGAADRAAEVRAAALGMAWMRLRPFPGYTSMPHLASAQAGERLGSRIADLFAEAAQAVFDGDAPPRPLAPWLAWLTLDGRLGQPRVPLDQIRAAQSGSQIIETVSG